VLNLVLALALVPSLGIRGAGIATVVSSAWFFVLSIVFSQRHYRVPYDWKSLGAALAVAIGALALGRAVIPIGGSHALAAGPLIEKAALTTLGSVLIAALLVRRGELTAGLSRWRHASESVQGSIS
jgi:O-antigen/teichoic acid export membrane protein